jgi:hypothetical protein
MPLSIHGFSDVSGAATGELSVAPSHATGHPYVTLSDTVEFWLEAARYHFYPC